MDTNSQSTSSGGGTYTWYARSAPMYIALLPIAVAIGVWFPDTSVLERLVAVAIFPAVLTVLLAEKGRDRGRQRQRLLWESWGGPLLTQYLRHRNTNINELLRLEYHRKLQQLLPNLTIPSADDEAADPKAADRVYDACAQHMVNVVREDPKRFRRAFGENRSYGFRRNLWGLKPLGVVCSLAAVLSVGLWLYFRWKGPETVTGPWLIAALLCAGLFVFWVFFATPGWVRIANDAYALRVVESLPKMGEGDALKSL